LIGAHRAKRQYTVPFRRAVAAARYDIVIIRPFYSSTGTLADTQSRSMA
jgi:hypothetical protein